MSSARLLACCGMTIGFGVSAMSFARAQDAPADPMVDTAPRAVAPTAVAPTAAAAPTYSAEELAARAALAERFVQMGKQSLAQQAIVAPLLKQNAALLEAAIRENPTEPRFLRLLVEARLQLGDNAGAAAAIRQYLEVLSKRSINDQVAQVKLIDLYAIAMETAEKKIEYLKSIAGADSLPSEVRSHAAMQLSRVYSDRGQETEAAAAVDDAVNLSPLNLDALRSKFARVQTTANDAERATFLLLMLKSNPSQPEVIAQVANELADNGLADQALNWFGLSFSLSGRLGRGLNMPDYLQYAAALLVAGQPRDSVGAAAKILESDPSSADAAFIKLMAERRLGDKDRIAAAQTQAAETVMRMLGNLHAQLEQKEPPASTQPSEVLADQALADVKKLKDGGDPGLYNAYVSGLSRAAWFDLYFSEQPAATAPKYIDALRSLLPEGDLNVARLEGWKFLVQGQTDEAKVKLSAVAERDPLSKLGLIKLSEKQDLQAANAELTRLAGDNAAGVTGAILVEALREHGVRFAPGANAPVVRAVVDAFPKDFLSVLDNPNQFYKIMVEPLKVSHGFGEPILAKLTIQNVNKYDLTVGADGVIKPDLWFDARILGLVQQSVQGVAYDRLGQQLVLKAHTGMVSQIVRVDEGQLAGLLQSNPTMSISLLFSVFTNPVPVQTGVSPGPGGYRVQFLRQVERASSPIADPQRAQALVYPLVNGSPEARIRCADLLGTYVQILTMPPPAPSPDAVGAEPAPGAKERQESAKQMATLFHDSLERAAGGNDASPAARAWLSYVMAMISPEANRAVRMNELLQSSDWEQRLLGLRVLQGSPVERQNDIAGKLAQSDPEPVVRAFAATVVETANMPPATQPSSATQPAASAPAGVEGGVFNLNPAVPAAPPAGGQ